VIAGVSGAGGSVIVLQRLVGLGLVGWQAPGSAGLWMAVAFLFGVQLFVLGVLGEYVGRVLEEVQNRPVFVVDDLVGLDTPPARRGR
jgi:dolichol-phosphate mannosyltransferase